MVRVLSVYQFTEEGELTIVDDINVSCLVPPDRIAIATSGLDVEIRNISDTKESFTFPAVDEVEEIHYCRNGNYLMTIESKSDNRNIKWRIVRIYCNWDGDPGNKSKSIAILRARIAGKVTPSDKYINSEDVEMIELPLKTQPRCVACCQVTGNIAIVAGNKVLFYQFKSCQTDTGRYNYVDFVEVPFFVELSFSPHHITMTEGVIACMNDLTFNLFKITEVYEPSISVDISDESFSSDASGSIRINTKDTLDFRTICKHSTINRQKFRVDVISDCDGENGANVDNRPETVHDMLIILRSLQDSETLSKYTIKPLLQLRLPCPVSQKPIYESFKGMSINPLYMRREMCPEKSSENIFGSKYSRNFVSVALVVATQQDGYLYQFYNSDEWRQNTDILATYSFTAPIVDLVLKDSVLHVLTETGVETYTLRIGQKIFYSPCEYFLNYSTTLDVIGPNFNDPICLLGLHSLPGGERIISSPGNLVILSKGRRLNTWKLNLLREPRAEQLYRNTEGYALKHRAENPKVFLHLMGEIHVMIRTTNELARVAPVEKIRNQVSLTTFSEHGDKEIENLFLESCRTLADFFVLSANEEEYFMALPYYLMGKLSVADIFNRCIQFEQLGVYSMGGIIYTLKQLFLRLQPGSEEMNFLSGGLTRTPSLLDNNNGNEIRLDRDGGFMKILFDLLLKYSPGDITAIALQSNTFLNRMGDQILEFLEGREVKTNDEILCVALQLVRKKRSTMARSILETIDTESLLSILSKNWTILFETSMNHKSGHSIVVFSEFTEHCLLMSQLESIQRLTATVLKYLLVNLQVLPFEVLLKMLIDFTSLRIGFAGSEIGKNILILTLEMYLMDFAEQRKLCADQSDSTDSASFFVTTSTVSNNTRSGQNQDSSRKMSSSMASDVDTALSIFGSTATGKAMKILVRSHLGFLSNHSVTQKKNVESKESSLIDFDIPEKEIDALFESLQKSQQILNDKCGSSINETMLFMDKRWNYLNLMPPIQTNFLDYLIKLKKVGDAQEKSLELDINVACVKLQALLASNELPDDIINEVSQFICSNPNLIGIESIISCLLPVPECTEFLVNVCPQCVLEFGKDRFTRNEDWAFLINCLQVQTSKVGDTTESNGGLLLFYHRLLKAILEYIANTKPLETVMKIFPEHEITQIPDNVAVGAADGKKSHSGHHPHEQSAFIQYIRVSVERERARKLKQVIVAKSNTLSAKINL